MLPILILFIIVCVCVGAYVFLKLQKGQKINTILTELQNERSTFVDETIKKYEKEIGNLKQLKDKNVKTVKSIAVENEKIDKIVK